MRGWILAAAVWIVPGLAFAKGPVDAFELHWEAPPTCPAQSDVRAEVQRLLGNAETPATGKVDAAAHVEVTPGGFELHLRLQQNHEVRERALQAPTCQELGRAAALVLALAVNPALQQEPPASPAEPPPCPPTEAAPVPMPPPVCPVPPSPAPQPKGEPQQPAAQQFALLAMVSVAYGELPRVTPRPGLGVSYRAGAHSVELAVGAAFGSVSRSPRAATFNQWFATPRYCLAHDGEHWRLGGCASVELGWVRASGFGVTDPKTSRALWLAPGLGGQANWKMPSGAELLLGADLMLGAFRERFYLADEQIFRTHLLIPAVRLGLHGGFL